MLVVKTTKNRSFGAFYQIFRNDYDYNYNNNGNNLTNINANINYRVAPMVCPQLNHTTTKNTLGNQIQVIYDHSMNYINHGIYRETVHIKNIKYYINIDPVQYPNSFFFSLAHLKIYNSNNSQFNISENPSFIIEYNNDKKIFCGTEKKTMKLEKLL